MKKKSFKGGLDSILEGVFTNSDRPNSVQSLQKKEKYSRQLYTVKISSIENMKKIAYWNQKTIKHIVNSAIDRYIDEYIKKNDELKPIPGPIDDDV